MPGSTTPIATLVGGLCAFGLVRSQFSLKPLSRSLILLPMVVPGMLLGAALLIVFVPLLGFTLSTSTAVAGHVVVTTPYAVLAVATRLYGYDRHLDAAAADLGASPWRVLARHSAAHHAGHHRRRADRLHGLSRHLRRDVLHDRNAEHPADVYLGAGRDGVTPTVNALGTLLILGSIAVLLVANLLLLRK